MYDINQYKNAMIKTSTRMPPFDRKCKPPAESLHPDEVRELPLRAERLKYN